jgi:hypothetical protein
MGKDSEKNSGEDGVSVPATTKDNKGRWMPGQSGNPKGRPTKAAELALLKEVLEAVGGEGRITDVLNKLLNHKSWRAQEAGLKIVLGYGLGNPIKRIQQVDGGLSTVLDELGE